MIFLLDLGFLEFDVLARDRIAFALVRPTAPPVLLTAWASLAIAHLMGDKLLREAAHRAITAKQQTGIAALSAA